jgi:hypothetical protein
LGTAVTEAASPARFASSTSWVVKQSPAMAGEVTRRIGLEPNRMWRRLAPPP